MSVGSRRGALEQCAAWRTVVIDTEGGLSVAAANRDGIGTPAEDDDKVLRILPPSTAGSSPL